MLLLVLAGTGGVFYSHLPTKGHKGKCSVSLSFYFDDFSSIIESKLLDINAVKPRLNVKSAIKIPLRFIADFKGQSMSPVAFNE